MYSKRHMRRLIKKQREIYLKRLLGEVSINDREAGSSNSLTAGKSASSREVVGKENLSTEHNNGHAVAVCKAAKTTNLNETLRDLKNTVKRKMVLEKLDSQDIEPCVIKSSFPLLSTEDLTKIEERVIPENRNLFVSILRNFFQQSIAKNLLKVLSIDLIMEYNIDGTHGKKRLKDFTKFYSVFLESISSLSSNDDPELQLRKAIQVHKKRAYQKKGRISKTLETAATKN